MKYPERLNLANLPTKIEKLEKFSKDNNCNVWIKRDDQTHMEFSGNKIRKLEYAVKEALDQGANYLITCGGIQSNHARATAAVAAKLGLKSHLVLRGEERDVAEGNLFLDKMLGAEITFISPDEYSNSRNQIMEEIKETAEKQGLRGYILPEGASNVIGSFGYIRAYDEIISQEKEVGVEFDAIVISVGSGGTYAGLYYGNLLRRGSKDIIGMSIYGSEDHFKEISSQLVKDIGVYTGEYFNVTSEDIIANDKYLGLGYGKSQYEEIKFIKDFAIKEGIVLDPVYTGKAMYGLFNEIESGNMKKYNNILFIHTGGIFGWTKEARSLI